MVTAGLDSKKSWITNSNSLPGFQIPSQQATMNINRFALVKFLLRAVFGALSANGDATGGTSTEDLEEEADYPLLEELICGEAVLVSNRAASRNCRVRERCQPRFADLRRGSAGGRGIGALD